MPTQCGYGMPLLEGIELTADNLEWLLERLPADLLAGFSCPRPSR